jgi:hypothetical protein
MAETASPAKGLGAQLGKKVGPFPLGVWLAGGVGVIWYLRKKQAAGSSTPAATTSQTGYGTDPAGNTGYIDPSTGYVYGSAEDIAALQSQGLVGANSYNTGGDGSTSGTGASGTDITGSASAPAVTGTSTTTGAATTPSGTAVTTPGASPTPTVPASTRTGGGAAPKNNSWKYPAPSGLAAYAISDSGFRLKWNAVTGPNGQKPSSYTVAIFQQNGTKVSQHSVNTTSSIEYGPGGIGLKPATSYKAQVWANGGPVAPPGSVIVVTVLPKGAK